MQQSAWIWVWIALSQTILGIDSSCWAEPPTAAPPPIYPTQQPELFSVWVRLGDRSPQLQSVEVVEFSPDGQFLASGGKLGYQVMFWRVADGQLLWQAAHQAEVECIAFSPDGKRLVSGGEDFQVRLWDAATGAQIHAWEHPSGLDGITWSHDGKIIASGSESGAVFFWDAQNYQSLGTVEVGSTVNSLQFSHDDQKLVVAGNIQTKDPQTGKTHYGGFATLVDVAQRKPLYSFAGHEGSVKSIRMTADERLVATGGFDKTARLYELQTGKLLHVFPNPAKVEAVAFTPDGNYLLVGGHERAIRFYRLSDFQLALTIPTPRTEYLDLTADGRLLATGHEDSGLLALYLFGSDAHRQPGLYHRLASEQLDNLDLKKNRP